LVTAIFGLPVTRVSTNRTACYQVYCEQRKRECVEQVEIAPAAIVHKAYRAAAVPDLFPSRLLDHSLFQRPPPSFFL
jgi:hypothetical protein